MLRTGRQPHAEPTVDVPAGNAPCALTEEGGGHPKNSKGVGVGGGLCVHMRVMVAGGLSQSFLRSDTLGYS